MSQYCRCGSAESRVTRNIRWKVRYARKCFYRRVNLAWAWIEIIIFCVPTHDSCVHLCHIQECQVPCPSDFTVILRNKVQCGDVVPVTGGGEGADTVCP